MEAFGNVGSLDDLYSLDSGQQKEIKMEVVEADNPHDITDDALETMLMDSSPTQNPSVESNAQSQTMVVQPGDLNQQSLTDNRLLMMSQPASTQQQKVSNPVVTRFVVKKTLNPSATPISVSQQQHPVGLVGVNSSASAVQTLTLQGNNFTFASPGKSNFKIPISPAKNSLKVSMMSPSAGVVQNSVKTINLHSSMTSTPLQSKFQFQTLVPNQQINVVGAPPRLQNSVNSQQQVLRIIPSNATSPTLANILPATQGSTNITISGPANQPKLQQFVNVQSVQRVTQPPPPKTQRLIMPATSIIQPQSPMVNLAPGTILQAGNVGYAMVSAKYVEQLKKQFNSQIYNNDTVKHSTSEHTQSFTKPSVNGKVRKPCNCTKSMCLKLYCECFANGHFCDGCNCINCHNNLEFDSDRSKAIKQCLDRNPLAFKPKIGRGDDSNRTHQKGCNCKRSGCLKNYCECYEARIPCTSRCKCIGCKNLEEDGSSQNEQLSLMHLADAAAVRCQQQAAAKSKISSQFGEIRSHHRPHSSQPTERLPSTFFTQEVIEATCTCLLAQAEEAEKTNRSLPVAEMMILEEFGRCMMQIIQAAGKAKSSSQS